MKKLNTKGFTLIELLAVITIMGILMMVAIPTVSRTIENSRKDTFIDTMKNYVNGAKNMWAADNLRCNASSESGEYVASATTPKTYLSSAVPTGTYYINVDSANIDSHPVLLEQGGKSSWGSRDVKGWIKIKVEDKNLGTDAEPNMTRVVTYYPVISDGVHGVNVKSNGASPAATVEESTLVSGPELVRGDIKMSGMTYIADLKSGAGVCKEV
ncbi:MAG: type II secretion system protein [Bacilli bacterium]|nr:type II secretion system protein [Bacilli bacterium]